MSIRNLTAQLQEETAEYQRGQTFESVRSVPAQTTSQADKQTPFMGAASKRKNVETAPPPSALTQNTTTPKIGLKAREQEEGHHIPGGIAARFGRQALKEPVIKADPIAPAEVTPEPVQEVVLESEESENVTAEAQEQERASEQDDAARITIELQSH